ncbi:hypothetical protein PAE9249_00679 [Paenibacillus sp. CECT 9249]|uniref:EamA family transporter n=1 Tax=Paenibacillus sp. CECT 9249 TaxID=2845385 RepID=UPI001E29040A|nr:DMT family transporter [Paenibacillus sp. CECT 9249]CAH0118212.1 hypothetical protein PAE9249_00679 [Paenibacillus sp. CECT 9249]
MKMLKYSLLVFLGACSYGTLSTIMKVGFADGFTVNELLGGQFFFGLLMLLILVLLFSRRKVKARQALLLMATGLSLSTTSVFYGVAVEELPASIAVVLLFQFTWIGIILEAIADRKFPGMTKLLSVAVLLAGTVFASGILEPGGGTLTAKGTVFGLLAAVSFAFYIFASGRVGTDVPVLSKSLFMVSGAIVMIIIVFSPSFLTNGAIANGLWKYAIPLALLGIIIPVIFFAIGVPKVGSGLGTILGAAELPAAAVAASLVLREEVTALRWIGIAIIIVGIALPQYYALRKPKRPKPSAPQMTQAG